MKKLITLTLMSGLLLSLLCLGITTVDATKKVAIGPELEEAIASGESEFEVIITFYGDRKPTADNLNLLENIGINKGLSLNSLPMVATVTTKGQIDALKKEDTVRSVYLNRKLEYFNADSTALTGVNKVRTDDQMRKQNGGFPVTGDGIGVVVNDSGVDGTHQDIEFGDHLVQNVMANANLNSLAPELLPITYAEGVINTDTNSGHGTHVAGTVGGTGEMSSGKHEGVAPGADLIGYGSGAGLFILDAIGGFDYAITHQTQYDIRVITNSWGSSGDFDPNDPVNIASKKAFDRGITVLFAAGNSGPGENTHNPYAKAPWVISVAAGEKDGTLADFSSRGTKGVGGTFEVDGQSWTWKDEPTITAPGVDIISTRVMAPVSSLAADKDAELIEPAYLPYYTTMSGTSMATPHVAGVVALMLEANPELSPSEVKNYLQQTATNMPGYESWEVGTGYVNAFAAVDFAFDETKEYGSTVNMNQTFNSNVESTTTRKEFEVDYNPVTAVSDNQYSFEVEEGVGSLVAQVNGKGIMEETGNPINLVLIAPDGTEYSSGISVLFTLYWDRTVSVNAPMSGTWKAEIRGLRGVEENSFGTALPETVQGTLAFTEVSGFSGLDDINGHPAGAAIQMGVKERLIDGYVNDKFKPDNALTRGELAQYLVMGAGIRQSSSATDLSPFVSAVLQKGATLKDKQQIQNGVMLATNGDFRAKSSVNRADLAYSLVQSLGLQEKAEEFSGEVTVQYKDERVAVEDSEDIPDRLKGYVQLALDLNIINAEFSVDQGPYDIEPTVTAIFSPNEDVLRGDFAVAMTRYYNAFLK
ncbi:serine protease AprX [Virgibacillus subterraneus]|uniref:Serine protease AprX n=1 Tax=Virgibacillus subterraneus TaxID=621109 RepID=A0A1H9FKR2_9BACI|nr:S8 family serine peptidase [Virgibacillus subterraneus]SEQ38083.1 serine protease AprX [Virgibacillus subterraneus]